jgi:hypothetical protein
MNKAANVSAAKRLGSIWLNSFPKKGSNMMARSPYKVATPIRAVAKPHSLYYPRENIGVKNFKKVENVCNHK